MKKKRLLDSYALLSYLNKEEGFQRVKELLSEARREREPLLMDEINIGEVYYILARKRSFQEAEKFFAYLQALPIKPIHNSYQDVIEAAKTKVKFSISYADSFVVVTAIKEDAIIITGDPDFKKTEDIVRVEWL